MKTCACWLVPCLGLTSAVTCALQVQPANTPAPRIHRKGGVGERHPITIREILSLSKPSNVRISPDGLLIAYVVTTPALGRNEDYALLYVTSAKRLRNPVALAEGIHIYGVRWPPDGKTVSYVVETLGSRQIWRVRPDGTQREQLSPSGAQIAQPWQTTVLERHQPYDISPDGRRIVYGGYDTVAADLSESMALRGGAVYAGEFVKPLSPLEYRRIPFAIWLHDIRQRSKKKIWATPTFTVKGAFIPEFKWSPDGRTVALLYLETASERYTLALLDTGTGTVKTLLTTLGFSRGLTWSDDGESLSFYSEGAIGTMEKRGIPTKEYSFRLTDNSLHQRTGDWDSSNSSFEQSLGSKASEGQEREEFLSSCSLDASKTRAACIRQAPMIPPEVVSVELQNGNPIGPIRILTRLNPQYDSIELGNISRLSWPSKDGEGSAGLILPTGFVSGMRYPLVIMLYNIYSGRQFIADAAGFTSYPAQAFAGHGYVVLLMNVPKYHLYPPGDFVAAREVQVDAIVADIRSAVDLVVAQGIVDARRMGIMGWSGGCFWTNYILTHQATWFQAAASGECAIHYPGQYWLGDDTWRERERNFFGGGPYGKYYRRWKEISPVLNVDRLRVPLLMEYSTSYTAGLEMRTAILEEGGQTELVIYADDEHVLLRPLNRYNSMMRHYDWFNFWLLGEEDSDSAKREQYARWRQMREKLATKQ